MSTIKKPIRQSPESRRLCQTQPATGSNSGLNLVTPRAQDSRPTPTQLVATSGQPEPPATMLPANPRNLTQETAVPPATTPPAQRALAPTSPAPVATSAPGQTQPMTVPNPEVVPPANETGDQLLAQNRMPTPNPQPSRVNHGSAINPGFLTSG